MKILICDTSFLRTWEWFCALPGIVRVDVSIDEGNTWVTAELLDGKDQPYNRAWAWTFWEASATWSRFAEDINMAKLLLKISRENNLNKNHRCSAKSMKTCSKNWIEIFPGCKWYQHPGASSIQEPYLCRWGPGTWCPQRQRYYYPLSSRWFSLQHLVKSLWCFHVFVLRSYLWIMYGDVMTYGIWYVDVLYLMMYVNKIPPESTSIIPTISHHPLSLCECQKLCFSL